MNTDILPNQNLVVEKSVEGESLLFVGVDVDDKHFKFAAVGCEATEV